MCREDLGGLGSQAVSGVLSDRRLVTTAELHERAAGAAAGFRAVGVEAGDSVALLLRNDVSFVEAMLAAVRVGASPVPLNWHSSAEEIAYVLEDSGAKVLVAHDDLLARVRGSLQPGLHVRRVEPSRDLALAYGLRPHPPCESEHDWAEWRDGRATDAVDEQASPRNTMFYTSGTTGRPKGVRRLGSSDPAAALQATLVQLAALGVEPGGRSVMAAPMYHAAPNVFTMASVMFGNFLVIEPRFEAERLLALIEEHRLSHLYLVPTMFVRLLRLEEAVRRRYDLSSLRRVTHGAAPCPEHVKRAMIDWLGPVVDEFYGGTEVGLLTGSTSSEWLEHPGTVGRALDGVTLKVLGPDGAELPVRTPGEIFARVEGFGDFTYENNPKAREEVANGDLVTIGDVGYLDEEGYLYLCDRKRDMVISGGANIYPIEIEGCLLTMAGVRDVAVFGIPDEEYGEVLAAVVEPEPGARLESAAVRLYVGERLGGLKVPRVVEFSEKLPREDSGKIFKRKLRDPYWAAAAPPAI